MGWGCGDPHPETLNPVAPSTCLALLGLRRNGPVPRSAEHLYGVGILVGRLKDVIGLEFWVRGSQSPE